MYFSFQEPEKVSCDSSCPVKVNIVCLCSTGYICNRLFLQIFEDVTDIVLALHLYSIYSVKKLNLCVWGRIVNFVGGGKLYIHNEK